MATVIDSLIVSLGLDPKGFTKGQKDAVEALRKTDGESTRASRKMQDDGKKAAEFFAKVRNEVLAIGGAFMGLSAIKSFVENITSGDAAAGRLAKNVDMSTESLSAWQGAAEKAGSTGDDIANAFRNITKINQEIRTVGTSSALLPLQRAGVDMAKFLDSSTTAEDRMKMLAGTMSKLSAADAQFFGQQAGFSESTINMLMMGNSSIDSLLAKQRAMNVVTDRDAKLAQQRQVAWRNLVDTFTSLGRTLLNDVSPVIIKILTQFENWVLKNKEWLATGIIDGIKNLANWLKSIDWNSVKSGFNSLLTVGMGIVNVLSMIIDGWNKISELFGKSNIGEGVIATINKIAEGWAKIGDVLGLNNETSTATSTKNTARNTKLPITSRGNAGLITNNTARMNTVNNSMKTSTTTTDVKVGQINIHTKATDAPGIARDISPSLRSYAFASQANSGVH